MVCGLSFAGGENKKYSFHWRPMACCIFGSIRRQFYLLRRGCQRFSRSDDGQIWRGEPPAGTPVQRGIVPGGEFWGQGGVPEVIFPEGF